MKYKITTCFGCLVAAGIILSGITAHSAPADVSDWVGLDNTADNNNYVVINDTSVGGNLMARIASGAYLADLNLAGGPITGSYQAYGSLTFDALVSGGPVVDPIVLIGFFNSASFPGFATTDERGGFAFADQSSTSFRLQMTASPQQSVVTEGSYEFRMEYDTLWSASGQLRVAFYGSGADVFSATPQHDIAGPRSPTSLDAFGIYQPANSPGMPNDIWSVTLANLHYTGMTAVPEPAAAALLGLGLGSVLLARRRNTGK